MDNKQHQQQQNKQTPPPPVQATAPTPEVDVEAWYLIPEVDIELQIADVWLATVGHHVPAENVVTELPLDRLHSRSSVYILCRKPVKGRYGGALRPHMPIVDTVDGASIHKVVPAEELVEDMKAYGPIKVSDHWSQGSNRFNSKLNRQSFMEAVGALAVPWAPRWKDHTRKDGDLPTVLHLRSA